MENKAKKRIKLRVAGNEFTLLSSEDEKYSRALADRVDRDIKNTCRTAITSVTGATILSALNYCDAMQKAQEEAADLRRQLSAYLEEIVELKATDVELEKEIESLKAENEELLSRMRTMAAAMPVPQSQPAPAAAKGHFSVLDFSQIKEDSSHLHGTDEDKSDRRDRRDKKRKNDQ